jgi:hypothetical protein
MARRFSSSEKKLLLGTSAAFFFNQLEAVPRPFLLLKPRGDLRQPLHQLREFGPIPFFTEANNQVVEGGLIVGIRLQRLA